MSFPFKGAFGTDLKTGKRDLCVPWQLWGRGNFSLHSLGEDQRV